MVGGNDRVLTKHEILEEQEELREGEDNIREDIYLLDSQQEDTQLPSFKPVLVLQNLTLYLLLAIFSLPPPLQPPSLSNPQGLHLSVYPRP